MLNTSIEICSNILNYNTTLHISYIVWHTCGLLCTMFGIPGHLFQILIMLNKTNRKQSISLYVIAIAIFELIFLVDLTATQIHDELTTAYGRGVVSYCTVANWVHRFAN
ncbi:unnamed protein product [Rotaria sordida]|uniref:Mos1 transposase HTH domain-containing protein n=1 Tax=Rotaria sordida TaxID=392033 RepID=A0A814IU92_9BILA|nr:unnamed protein product [Rotaria sordida]